MSWQRGLKLHLGSLSWLALDMATAAQRAQSFLHVGETIGTDIPFSRRDAAAVVRHSDHDRIVLDGYPQPNLIGMRVTDNVREGLFEG